MGKGKKYIITKHSLKNKVHIIAKKNIQIKFKAK